VPDESSHVDIIAAEQEPLVPPVEDVDRAAVPGEPPEPGAQWDEVHRRWERWDEATQSWTVVGDDPGDGVDPSDENPLPALLAREVLHADELEAADEPDVEDVDRVPEPPAHVPGAQWNEVAGRWERWDDTTGTWLPVDS
jgi:hypothetical protein